MFPSFLGPFFWREYDGALLKSNALQLIFKFLNAFLKERHYVFFKKVPENDGNIERCRPNEEKK